MQQNPGSKGTEQAEQPESLSEAVGKMAEQSQADADQAAATDEKGEAAREEAVKPNRKKRMWEGEKEAGYLAHQQRDEL